MSINARKVSLSNITLGLPDMKTQSLSIRLGLSGHNLDESIEFAIQFQDFARLIKELQEHQARHKLPIPASLRPLGPPALSIVSDD